MTDESTMLADCDNWKGNSYACLKLAGYVRELIAELAVVKSENEKNVDHLEQLAKANGGADFGQAVFTAIADHTRVKILNELLAEASGKEAN